MSNTPSDPHLAKFKRPENDNGRGLHFVLDPAQPNVEGYAPWLQTMQMKWAVVYAGDELQVTRVAKYLHDNFGIVSNMRVYASGEKPKVPDFWFKLAQRCVEMDIPPYIQIFNEPEDGREGFDSPEHFGRLWNLRANAVVEGGGYPGLQILAEEFLGRGGCDRVAKTSARICISHCTITARITRRNIPIRIRRCSKTTPRCCVLLRLRNGSKSRWALCRR